MTPAPTTGLSRTAGTVNIAIGRMLAAKTTLMSNLIRIRPRVAMLGLLNFLYVIAYDGRMATQLRYQANAARMRTS